MLKIKIWQNEVYKDPYSSQIMQQVAIRIEKGINWQSISLQIPLKVDLEYYNKILSNGITEALNKLLDKADMVVKTDE